MTWKPGQSGNPHGRPISARNRIAERIIEDLRSSWEEFGVEVLDKLAKENPTDFAKLAFGVLPRDVLVSIEQRRLPGGLEQEDWPLVVEILEAVRAAFPDANERKPGEVFAHVRAALSLYGAKQIEPSTSTPRIALIDGNKSLDAGARIDGNSNRKTDSESVGQER